MGDFMNILTAIQTKNIENRAIRGGMSGERLMENAGAAATRVIREHFEIENKRVVIVTGNGNNGGDGFVVARKLKEYGAKVFVIMAMGVTVTPSSSSMYNRAREAGINPIYYYDDPDYSGKLIASADILVDAIFGIGFRGVADKDTSACIVKMNSSKAKRVALDLPSGITADIGEVKGIAFKADLTVSFIAYKPCHFLFPSSLYCGRVTLASIGIEIREDDPVYGRTIDVKTAIEGLEKIPKTAHKGSLGTAAIVAGSYGMAGAAAFSAKAAIKSGAGLVKVSLPEKIYPIVAGLVPEAVYNPLKFSGEYLSAQSVNKSVLEKADSLLIGPGLGNNADTASAVYKLLKASKVPTVIDADGLNILSENVDYLREVKAPLIVTPHPGEMARLTGKSIEEIEANKALVALEFAASYGVITVLKGAYTVIAEPGGKIYINKTGNEGMASAGSGDMLSGMIAAFLANGTSPLNAAVYGVCLHGAVGDITAKRLGTRGMTVTDMLSDLPLIFKN